MLRTCPMCGCDDFLVRRLRRRHLTLLVRLKWPVRCAKCGMRLPGPALPILAWMIRGALPPLPQMRLRLRMRLGSRRPVRAPRPAIQTVRTRAHAPVRSVPAAPPQIRKAPPPETWLWQVQ